jgi:hypothetical protein
MDARVRFIEERISRDLALITAAYLHGDAVPVHEPSSLQTFMHPGEWIVLEEQDTEKRRSIHNMLARGWVHLSFFDPTRPHVPRKNMFCEDCNRWVFCDRASRYYCCVDDFGEPACSNYSLTCPTCEGFLDDTKEKNTRTNNVMFVIMQSSLDAKVTTKLIRNLTGMRTRTIRRKLLVCLSDEQQML